MTHVMRLIGRMGHICMALAFLVAGQVSWAADYVVLASGVPSGEMSVTVTPTHREISYRFNDRGRGPDLRSRVALDTDLIPANLSVNGVDYYKLEVAERFEQGQASATWRATNDSGSSSTRGFYLARDYAPEHLAILARALLRAPGRRLSLLPAGEARLEPVMERTFLLSGAPRRARLFLITGIDLEPSPIWLDDQGELLLDGSSWFVTVRRDAVELASEIVRVQTEALEARDLARSPALMRRPLGPILFRNVSLYDAENRRMRAHMTVVVRGQRIETVARDGEITAPADAIIIEGAGRTLLPGFWDMHTHITSNREGLLHLAAGVTSVRDLGNSMEETLQRQRRFDALDLAGPRMTLAGFIDGPGPLAGPIRVYAANAEELRAAMRNYADHGYRHIKLYSSLDPALIPVAVEEARRLGLRLSGHVPANMTMRQVVEAGFDEVHHLNFTALNFMGPDINERTNGISRITAIAEHAWELDPGSPQVGEFIRFLRARRTVVDPTMNLYESHLLGRQGRPDPALAAVIDRLPPVVQRASRSAGLAQNEAEVQRNAASFQTMLGLLRALFDSGVPLVAGTDAMAGFTYHRELELYEMAGIPPPDVLHIATLGAARIAGRDVELGSIAPGKLADLVLVVGAPAERISDVRNVALVMRDGVLFDPAVLLSDFGIGSGN
ncbi:amidohydrolase family protein [Sphingosinicella sp. LHD-64]|uniref:amidohydrolase family protein n=1 Tax=Sphingosinicella sp. LHD-64 TaxID=3072139 RepID=UPI00280D41FD|nr:amidohydrolase family protein [Sphingosinicella sp. LHD-64]MDQ8756203.1 amidohydrolase family protein [Sphingosinicella sp. LHD-64]